MNDLRATPITADLVRGALELEAIRDGVLPHRLPGWAVVRDELPDRLHPDDATHRLIGERFAAHAFAAGGPFA